jgi:hypothetical protein
VAGALALHAEARAAAQFVINDRRQSFQRALVSVTPGAQQLADVVHITHPLNYTAASGPSK